ncbi:MAG: hypothetical protein WB919_07660 [Candidatus Sulfotelmatobacter sp.]
MREEYLHVADDELLLHSSGELASGVGALVAAHVGCCAHCRTRLKELENTMAEFGKVYLNSHAAELAQARVLPKARLAELAAQKERRAWMAFFEPRQAAAFACIVVAVCLFLTIRFRSPHQKFQPKMASVGHWDKPDLRLTPGAAVPVTKSEVCAVDAEKTVPVIPVSLRRKVFEIYGVTTARPDENYEVDYLITPELGGATDIRNLWPEPYQDTLWNAHVKDQLEDRLHQMVCHGDVDLATAQHDISTDWIAAYRKYFRTDRPLMDGSSFNPFSANGSHPST